MNLGCCLKEVKPLVMYDGEQGIALHAMQGNRASSPSEWEVSWFCPSCGRNLGYVLALRRGEPLKSFVASASSGFLSSYNGHLRNRNKLGRTIRTLLELRQETEVHFLVGRVILGFLSIFKKSQASSPFEALHSVCLLRCQRDVIPPVQMRRRPMAFSRVSTGDSDIPSSCEMKDEPEFKLLQGNSALF